VAIHPLPFNLAVRWRYEEAISVVDRLLRHVAGSRTSVVAVAKRALLAGRCLLANDKIAASAMPSEYFRAG